MCCRNFVRVEVISYEHYHLYNGDRLKLKMDGLIRVEGRRYVINDGDILDFYFNPITSISS
jgi:ribosome-binding ATPase YchF (GTP1/OBG family)